MTINNATPQSRLNGVKDASGGVAARERVSIPQHLPMVYFMGSRGPDDYVLASGGVLTELYGEKTFDPRGKFMTHQLDLAKKMAAKGNALMMRRLIPADAAKAKLVLGLEIVEDDLPTYQRTNGVIDRDGNNDKVVDGVATIDGYRARWVVMAEQAGKGIDEYAIVNAGTLAGRGGSTASIYPIQSLETLFGDDYNGCGIRLSAPTVDTSNPADQDVIEDQQAFIYRAQLVRKTSTGTPVVVNTMETERSIDFAWKEGVFSRKTNADLNAERIVDAYGAQDPGFTPVYGPFDKTHVYYENIQTVLDMILAKENVAAPTAIEEAHLINLLTAKNYDGTENYAFLMDDTSLTMDGRTNIFAAGGSDGTVDLAALETAIIDEMETVWDNPNHPLLDRLRYPISHFYDTGFKQDVKVALFRALGKRKDVRVSVAVQDLAQAPLSESEVSSVGAVLAGYAGLYQESEVWGTGVIRADIFAGSMIPATGDYKKRVTSVHDIALKRVDYQGSGDGKMRSNARYDVEPGNVLAGYRGVTNTWRPHELAEKHWANGINYYQYGDVNTLFWPAYQTVYKDDTSVLNSAVIVDITTDIQKLLDRVWAAMTGRSDLTNQQYEDMCVRKFNEMAAGRYDGRVRLEPVCYHTPADEARGYSATMDVNVYANVMKTVMTFNVISHRED